MYKLFLSFILAGISAISVFSQQPPVSGHRRKTMTPEKNITGHFYHQNRKDVRLAKNQRHKMKKLNKETKQGHSERRKKKIDSRERKLQLKETVSGKLTALDKNASDQAA